MRTEQTTWIPARIIKTCVAIPVTKKSDGCLDELPKKVNFQQCLEFVTNSRGHLADGIQIQPGEPRVIGLKVLCLLDSKRHKALFVNLGHGHAGKYVLVCFKQDTAGLRNYYLVPFKCISIT